MKFIAAAIVLACALASSAARATQSQPKTPEDYPPARPTQRAYAFALNGKTNADAVRKALAALSTKDATCRIAFGPASTAAHPKRQFALVEAPLATAIKDLEKALERGGGKAEQLAFACFGGGDGDAGAGAPGYATRDFVMGISNDLRWFESDSGFRSFYFTPGKLQAAGIAEKYTQLVEPFRGPKIGALATAKIRWPLDRPIDPAAAKRAEKTLAKLGGVRSATIDPELGAVWLEIALDGALSSGPLIPAAAKPGAGPEDAGAPRPTFDTSGIFDALDREKIAVKGAASEGSKNEPVGK